ncbi:hypothetical protein IPdc08_00038 [archaeon]|nr:hypothetical protein IPdc08_00038 [archaeon]
MITLNCTLFNFLHQDELLSVFGGYAGDFEYTTDGIFRKVVPPFCPGCGAQTTYNDYNTYTKKVWAALRSAGTGVHLAKSPWRRAMVSGKR